MGVHVWKENGSYTVTYLADCIQVPAARDLAVPKKIKTWRYSKAVHPFLRMELFIYKETCNGALQVCNTFQFLVNKNP